MHEEVSLLCLFVLTKLSFWVWKLFLRWKCESPIAWIRSFQRFLPQSFVWPQTWKYFWHESQLLFQKLTILVFEVFDVCQFGALPQFRWWCWSTQSFLQKCGFKKKKKINSKKCDTKYLSQSTCVVAISYDAPKTWNWNWDFLKLISWWQL